MAYIDTQHLGKCDTCRHHRSGGCNTFCDCGEEYFPDLSKIPTADVVKVVRCKDCRNFGEDVGMSKDGVWARCFLHQRIMCEKDYCSYGTPNERSEE